MHLSWFNCVKSMLEKVWTDLCQIYEFDICLQLKTCYMSRGGGVLHEHVKMCLHASRYVKVYTRVLTVTIGAPQDITITHQTHVPLHLSAPNQATNTDRHTEGMRL